MSYDIAAYIWPAYTGKENRSRIFWPDGIGEWQSVKNAVSKFEGHDWNTRRPLWGYVDEADPEVMEMQIDCATSHGVNVFIYDWYWYDGRPFLEQCLNDGFLKAKNCSNMKFYLMWANHDANYVWDIRNSSNFGETVVWKGTVTENQFKEIAIRIIERYFIQENYYIINGCPVFMIYDIGNLIRSFGSIDNAANAMEWWRDECVKRGFNGLHLQLTMWNENSINLSGVDSSKSISPKNVINSIGFDSMTHYQQIHFNWNETDFVNVSKVIEDEWEKMSTYPITYFPHVSVGWDNNPRFTNRSYPVVTNNTPSNFEKLLVKAKEYVDKHLNNKLITINSWNEWTETSYLEPDTVNGYGYLEAIKRVFYNK